MPRRPDVAVGVVAAVVLGSAASQAGAQADTSVEALLRLHHDQRIAHVERAPERLVALFADPLLEISPGALAYRSRREPVPVAERLEAYEILHAAREAVGGQAAVAAVSMLSFDAAGEGPRGPFRTRVRSARDGRIAFRQSYPDRPALETGVGLAGGWRREGGGSAVDSLGAGERAFLRAHEMHLLATAPESHFSGPRAVGREAVAGYAARVVRFLEPGGGTVDFFYRADTGLPLGFRLNDPAGPRSTAVVMLFDDWRAVGSVHLPFAVEISQGDETFRYRVTEASTDWLPDQAFGCGCTAANYVVAATAPFDPRPQGRLEILEMRSSVFDNTRQLRVWLPIGYDDTENRGRSYPVLYLNDGQNLFDDSTARFGSSGWQVDEVAANLQHAGRIQPIVVVGIDNAGRSGRAREYLPYPDEFLRPPEPDPQGGLYPDFLAEDVIPFVERRFRVERGREGRTLGGSSYGALAALYVAISRPDLFSTLLLESPSFYVDDNHILRAAAGRPGP